MKLKQAFVYIIYGESLPHYQEAVLSIATLRRYNDQQPIVVLTDRPDRFSNLPGIRTEHIDQSMLDSWLGGSTYHFRIKLEGLRYLLQHHIDKALFLDTDTIVRGNLIRWFDRIDAKQALLHKFEGRLGSRRFRRQYGNVLGRTFTHPSLGKFRINNRAPMYNSGVIGLCGKHLAAVDIALWLMNEVNALVEIHTAEQMALGFVLSRQGKIRTVGDRNVYHYWHSARRRYIRAQLRALLRRHSPDALLSDPELTRQMQWRRRLSVWTQDKVQRMRVKIGTRLAKYSRKKRSRSLQ